MAKKSTKSSLYTVWQSQLEALRPYMIQEDCADIATILDMEVAKVRNAVYYGAGQAVMPIIIKELTRIINERIVLTEESQAQINQMLSTTVG